jgi:site-specific DNA-methyltransferase (adenine-specific)
MDGIQLYHGDCFDIMQKLPAQSVDAIITDPPFGALNVKWDVKPDYVLFNVQVRRLVKDFYAFFGQMPNFLEPILQNERDGWTCLEHISWVKRNGMPGGNGNRLTRTHESIFIYTVSGRRQFHQIKGPYEDVKVPGILLDTSTIEGIDRHIKSLWKMISDNKPDSHMRAGSYKKYSEFKIRFDRGRLSSRSPREVNYTNVWSFLPPSKSQKMRKDSHPTEKPIEVMMRLVEMLAPEGGTVLDPFMGTGSTGIACKRTGRRFIGIEKDASFFSSALSRIQSDPPLLR